MPLTPRAPTLKGLIQTEVSQVFQQFGSATYAGPPDPAVAQQVFINDLSTAIANAVYTYLQTNATYIAPAIPAGPLPIVLIP
jgi:hypothetical protein